MKTTTWTMTESEMVHEDIETGDQSPKNHTVASGGGTNPVPFHIIVPSPCTHTRHSESSRAPSYVHEPVPLRNELRSVTHVTLALHEGVTAPAKACSVAVRFTKSGPKSATTTETNA